MCGSGRWFTKCCLWRGSTRWRTSKPLFSGSERRAARPSCYARQATRSRSSKTNCSFSVSFRPSHVR
ncbi:MAG: hypothetical protein ABIO24_02660 [Saprospiraceae bacterium]